MIDIRPAIYKEVAEISRIIVQSESTWSKAMVQDCFGPAYKQWVVERQQKVVGCLIVHVQEAIWEIMQIAVDVAYHRQGYAKQLLTVLLEQAKQNHVQLIRLEVRASNQAALALYQVMQFQQVGVRKKFYQTVNGNGREDALLFDRVIK